MTIKFTAENGKEFEIADIAYRSLRSAFLVLPWRDDVSWAPFSYATSHSVAGDPTRVATTAHTNLMRDGRSGLPKDHWFDVARWRATASLPLIDPVIEFAADCEVTLTYNRRVCGDTTLLDLLLGPQPMGLEKEGPLRIHENLEFVAHVRAQNREPLERLRDYLRGVTSDAIRDACRELGMLAGMAGDLQARAVADGIRRVQERLMPGRILTAWIHLDGIYHDTI